MSRYTRLITLLAMMPLTIIGFSDRSVSSIMGTILPISSSCWCATIPSFYPKPFWCHPCVSLVWFVIPDLTLSAYSPCLPLTPLLARIFLTFRFWGSLMCNRKTRYWFVWCPMPLWKWLYFLCPPPHVTPIILDGNRNMSPIPSVSNICSGVFIKLNVYNIKQQK